VTARKCCDCDSPAAPDRARCQPHLDRARKYQRAWARNNPEKVAARKAYNKARYPRKHRNWVLKSTYGITVDDYDALMEQQNGVCAICLKPETVIGSGGEVKALAVDHCHKTNRVRGLLCNNCNRALGLLNDEIDLLRAAVGYLGA
jgi:hypothetical protein